MQGIRKNQVPAGNCLHQLSKSAYVDCDLSLVRDIVRFVQQGYVVSFDNVVRKSTVYFMINVFYYPMMADIGTAELRCRLFFMQSFLVFLSTNIGGADPF